MTRFLLNVLLVLCISAAAAPALGDDGVRTIRMEVQGLVCGFCAQGIDAQMREFDATRDVYVNLERGLVAVELDPGADIADEVLDKALTDAGYTLGAISRIEQPLAEVRDEVERDPR